MQNWISLSSIDFWKLFFWDIKVILRMEYSPTFLKTQVSVPTRVLRSKTWVFWYLPSFNDPELKGTPLKTFHCSARPMLLLKSCASLIFYVMSIQRENFQGALAAKSFVFRETSIAYHTLSILWRYIFWKNMPSFLLKNSFFSHFRIS